jgi:hypothetical protein
MTSIRSLRRLARCSAVLLVSGCVVTDEIAELACPTGVDVARDPANCGACGHACGAARACVGGTCVDACPRGQTSCGGTCVDTRADPNNCSGCGVVCALPHAVADCVQGACGIGACVAGFGDCDGAAENGCEATLATNANCGACGNACAVPNGAASCATGTCQLVSCDVGFVLSAGDCVVDLTQTGWSFSEDAGPAIGHPNVQVTALTPTSVTVAYSDGDVSLCGCNAQRTVLALGRTWSCAAATIAFEYHTDPSFKAVPYNAPSIQIRFLTGAALTTPAFYGGAQLIGSEETGVAGMPETSSTCAFIMKDYFPATPQVHEGLNVLHVGSLMPAVSGSCQESFNAIELHLQGYSCGGVTNASTLSNLRVF